MSWRPDRPLLVRAAALLFGGALVGLGVNKARPSGVAVFGFEAPTTCTAATEQEAPIVEMGPREASTLCAHPGVVFADTRPAAQFAAGHVVDALHLPCDTTASGAEIALKDLARAETVIVYGDSTDDGRTVAETLRRHGLKADIRVLGGGFPAWEKEGLACASGPCRECTIATSKDPHP